MRVERALFAAGVGLVAWLLHHIGFATVAHQLGRIGWGFAAVLALESVPLVLATLGWRSTLTRLRGVRFASLAQIRLAGDAVNSVAPAAVVGGEIARAKLLAPLVSTEDAVASVAMAAFAQFLAQILFVGVGSVLVPAGPSLFRQRAAGAILMILLALVWAIQARSRRSGTRGGSPRSLRARTEALTRRLAARSALLAEIAKRVERAFSEESGGLARSVLFFLAGWAVSGVEVLLVLALLGRAVSVRTAFSIAVWMIAVEGILFFVPARAGVAEGGLYAIFSLLGLNPVDGFCVAIVRRVRELSWAAIGLAIFALRRRGIRSVSASSASERSSARSKAELSALG